MFKIITNNWGIKLICLILALGLWTYVAIGESRVENLPGKIPLTIKNTPANLVAITDVETVQIKVSADRATWQKLSANSFEASINLSGLTQGTHEVSVSVSSSVDKVEIVDINPNKVLVRLEPMSKKNVPIKVQTEGQAGEGLVPGEATLSTDQAEISGAKSIVDKILEATAIIQLNGETAQIEKTVSLVALDAQGEIIKNVNFSPKDVAVTLPIVKAGTSKSVGVNVKLTGNPKSGFWVSQITTTPVDLIVSGSSGILRTINSIDTKNIDIEGISANLTKSVDLDLPSGVTLANNVTRVQVQIVVSALSSTKSVAASLVYKNLASNLRVDSVDPNNVQVLITGPANVLDGLTSNDVQINLDLSSYSGAGSYSIDINRNMISAPNGVGVASFVPSAIRITLANK